jgi:hypothetical protein
MFVGIPTEIGMESTTFRFASFTTRIFLA